MVVNAVEGRLNLVGLSEMGENREFFPLQLKRETAILTDRGIQ